MSIKKLKGALLLLFCMGAAYAAEPKVSVVDKDGNKVFFEKSEIKSINLKPQTIEIVDFDGKVSTFSKDAIAVINLAHEASKVETVTDEGSTLMIEATRDMIKVQNAVPSTEWYLYDTAGQLIKSGISTENELTIDIAEIENGIYLFSIGGNNIKFIK